MDRLNRFASDMAERMRRGGQVLTRIEVTEEFLRHLENLPAPAAGSEASALLSGIPVSINNEVCDFKLHFEERHV